MISSNGDDSVLTGSARRKTRHRVAVFLEAYRSTASVVAAAKIAGIHRSVHYERLKKDPAYQAAFARAKEEVSHIIEGELFRRAVHGEPEPVFHRGKKIATVLRKSDMLLTFIARGAMPEKYREHAAVELSGSIDLVQIFEAQQRVVRMRERDAGNEPTGTS